MTIFLAISIICIVMTCYHFFYKSRNFIIYTFCSVHIHTCRNLYIFLYSPCIHYVTKKFTSGEVCESCNKARMSMTRYIKRQRNDTILPDSNSIRIGLFGPERLMTSTTVYYYTWLYRIKQIRYLKTVSQCFCI